MAMTRHSLQPLCGDKGRTMCAQPPVLSEIDGWSIKQCIDPAGVMGDLPGPRGDPPPRGSACLGLGPLGAWPSRGSARSG